MGERGKEDVAADAVTEVTEPFARLASAGELREERIERVGDAAFGELLDEVDAEPRAFEVTPDIESEETRHAADEADIAGIGPCATVGAAGDADAEPLGQQAMTRQALLDRIDERRLDALRLGQRQPAGR